MVLACEMSNPGGGSLVDSFLRDLFFPPTYEAKVLRIF